MKNQDIANTFNDYFGLVVSNLNLFQWNEHNGEKTQKNVEILSKNLLEIKSFSLLCM